MRPTAPVIAACAAALSLVLAGCTGDGRAVAERTLVVGVADDAPGFSTVDAEGRLVGFDIDVARYVADALGWSDREVEFRAVAATARELALKSGEVDLVVGTFRITSDSERLVDFAGPYLTARQDLLVAADEAAITGPHSLDGRTLCSVVGSPDAAVVRQDRFSPGVRLSRATSLGACVDALLGGEVDAVTGDDVVLAGYVAEHPGLLRTVGSPFVEHAYGIGLPEGSPDVAVVDDVLREMASSGTWHDSYAEHLGDTGAPVPEPPVPGVR
jgi:glutamate transport system substrate-binding protein